MHLLVGTVDGVFDTTGRALAGADRIHHVARGPDGWWAVGEGGMWHDGELTVARPAEVALTCVLPTGDTVWVGGDHARLYRLAGGALDEDRDFADAPGRDSWYTPWGGPPDVRSLTAALDGTLYVNVHVGGIVRHGPDGTEPTLDIDADVHQVVAHPDRHGIVVAASARGLAQSADGRNFEFRTGGLPHRYCRAVAVHGETILLSSSRGPRGGDARLHVGRIGGGDFVSVSGLPTFDDNVDTHCVVAGPGGWFVAHDDTVWGSDDEGGSWRVLVEGLPEITCLA